VVGKDPPPRRSRARRQAGAAGAEGIMGGMTTRHRAAPLQGPLPGR